MRGLPRPAPRFRPRATTSPPASCATHPAARASRAAREPARCRRSLPASARPPEARGPQRPEQRRRVRVPFRRILGETSRDDPVERRRHLPVERRRRHRRVALDRREDLPGRLAGERPARRQHLVEDHAEGEHVGRRPEVLAARLLGRHVRGRAEHQLRAALRDELTLRAHVSGALGEPEVEDLELVLGADDDVVRLEVAVDDAGRVRLAHARRDLATRSRARDARAAGRSPSSARSGRPSTSSIAMKTRPSDSPTS